MKSRERMLWKGIMAGFICLITLVVFPVSAVAADNGLSTMNAGAAIALDADITLDNEELDKIVSEVVAISENEVSKTSKPESTLVMANVKESLNVRAQADDNSEKVGVLYKDCGGKILEQQGEWTKIQSGDVVGWAKTQFLLFGDEAESLAGEVGNLVAKANTDALRVHKSKSNGTDIYGLMAVNDEVIAVEEQGDWVAIDFDGQTGYVLSEYVSIDFKIDAGETMEVIQERERKEAEEKAKLIENRGAVPADVSELTLLAALIQCEAGGESYEGQLAVGAVVMNRLRSGAYPNALQGVIYASGQFTPALNGKVARVAENGPKESCYQAAQEALNGLSNVGGATHFKRVGLHDGYVMGNHVFW